MLTYPTAETIAPKYWSTKPGKGFQRAVTNKTFPGHLEFNAWLDRLESTAKDVYRRFVTDECREPLPKELKEALDHALGRTSKKITDLFTFIDEFIASDAGKFNTERKTTFHRATVNKFKITLEHVHSFVNHRHKATITTVPFNEVDSDFLAGFVTYLTQEKNYAANTVVRYTRTLRMLLRRAKDQGHPVSDQVFGRRLAMREEMSDEIYLTKEELEAFYTLDLSRIPHLDKARDLFVAGAFTGLRFGDLSRLQPEHVVNDKNIKIPTSKTGKLVEIPMHWCLREIMSKYQGRIPSGISNQKQNEYLKKAAALLPCLQTKVMVGRTVGGIKRDVAVPKFKLVKTHTARRSFASNLYREGINSRTIMAITGHTTEQSFMRYIRLSNEEHMNIIAMSQFFQRPMNIVA